MIKQTLFFGNRAYLYSRNEQLVIQRRDENDKPQEVTRPIEDIGVMVIESEHVSLSAHLISKLIENNVAVIFCDAKHMPSGLLMPLEKNSVQSEVYNAQIACSQPLRKQLWQQTVVAKIRNQAAVLKIANDTEVGNMMAWSKQVASGDASNLEGRAAVYYWQNLFPEYPDFLRHEVGDNPNALLNYGYAILRSVIARSLVSSGLLPTLGIFHKNKYNAYCLADDIMEPYRPYVDMLVLEILRKHRLGTDVTIHSKRVLLTLPTVDVEIKNMTRPLMIAASMTTASLAKCYQGETRKIIYPEIKY